MCYRRGNRIPRHKTYSLPSKRYVIHQKMQLGYMNMGCPRPDCFLWASSACLLIPHSHELFTNFIGLPRPNNLILIFGFYEPAINPLLFQFTLILCPWDAISFFPGFFEPVCLFKAYVYIVGLVTHYSCRLGLMIFFNYSQSISCGPHHWAFLSIGLSTSGPQH